MKNFQVLGVLRVLCVLCVLCVLIASSGCGASMFGSSFSHTTTAPGMRRSEKRVQGMGTTDTQITENYSGAGAGYGAYGGMAGPVVGMPGTYVAIPAAPQSYQCTGGNCNTIPYVENSLVREVQNQHNAIQNLRDIERCRAQGGSSCK